MSMNFGKLNFAVGFNRTSAFPLDANSYFESYSAAQAAASTAAEVGSSDSAYYIGQLIIVKDENNFGLYQIGADKTLVKFGQASSADALAADVATLKSYFTNGIANKASADASGNVITSTYATKTEMNTAIQSAVAGAVQYLGIANSKDDLVAPNSTGDFYRAGTAFDLPAASSQTGAVVKVHVGDLIICEDKETPKWSVIHGEEIGVASIAADGSGVSITGTATNPKVKLNAATTTTLGGVIVGNGLTVDTNGKLNSTAATQITTAINALDVEAVNLGAGETVKSISETDGKIAVTTQSISINQSQVSGLSAALDAKANNIDLDNKLDKSALTVSATAGVTLGSVTYKYELPQANESTLGGVKSTKTGITAGRDYNVEVNSNGTMKVNVPWTDTKTTDTNQKITAKLNGSNVAFGNNDTVEVVAGTNVTVTPNTTNKTITIAAQDTNTAHSHSAGVGLTGSGTAGISGTYTYKVNLVDETKASNAASYTSGAASKFYAVQLDKNDKLGVYVPWTDTTYTLPVASAGALGGIKVGYEGTTAKTYAVKLDANNKAYVEVPWENTTYTNGNGLTLTGKSFSLNVASSAMHGGIKLYNDKLNTEITPQAATNTNGRYYRIQLDNANRAFVNVPWTDTKYTLPTASATVLGGVKIGSGITITDGVISLTDKNKYDGYETNKLDKSALTISATAGVTLDGTTYKYTLPEATDAVLGGIKFNKRYTFDKEFTPAAESVVQASSQLYPLVCDQSGTPFVYVPWTDTKYTLTQANANNLGGIKIGYTTSDRNFAVQLDPNGKAYVTVPASAEYQLPTATDDTLGGIKAKQSDGANDIQYITNKKAYGVMVNASGHAWVGIPDTISTDKITQGTNTLIINGGGANW